MFLSGVIYSVQQSDTLEILRSGMSKVKSHSTLAVDGSEYFCDQ